MTVKRKQTEKDTIYFNTFTCYQWMSLIEITQAWDLVYTWFREMKEQYNVDVVGYVTMPNHIHSLLHVPKDAPYINTLLANGKRFMAYDIVERLTERNEHSLIQQLQNAVSEYERKKGQKHKIFITSSDIKECYTEKFLLQKLNYMHANPVSGKWNLVDDYTYYPHSSAGFYERNVQGLYPVVHYKEFMG